MSNVDFNLVVGFHNLSCFALHKHQVLDKQIMKLVYRQS